LIEAKWGSPEWVALTKELGYTDDDSNKGDE